MIYEETDGLADVDNGKTKDGGFTLLEVLISIVLMGIILLIIGGAMRLGARSIESGEKRIDALERIRSSFNIVDSQLQSSLPLTYEDNGNYKYYFEGGRKFMRFATNYSIWGGEKGYVVTTYTISDGGGGKEVLYASENVIGMEGTRETKLFDNFERMYFEYFYKAPTDETGSWVDQWKDDTMVPEKVRIHFIEWGRDLSLIIPMRVQGSSSGPTAPGESATGDYP
jgi:general secretion pathway protein J